MRIGQGEAYGIEAALYKQKGSWQGSLSYVYSRSFRTIAEINEGEAYPTFFDQPHSIRFDLSCYTKGRWQFTANWQYRTGAATTLPIGSYQIGDQIIPIFSARNARRLPDFHRLDLAATLKGKSKSNRSYQGQWVFSIYNAYARKNTLSLDLLPRAIEDNVPDPTDVALYRTYIFSIIPSVAYHFKF